MDEQNNELTIDELKKQRDEYLAGWKRSQADYQNLKRESERDKAEISKYALERSALEFLPPYDGLEFAYAAAKELAESLDLNEGDRETFKKWMHGLQATLDLWLQSSKRIGLEIVEIEIGSQYNPQTQEAVMAQPAEGKEPGSVVRMVQSGWTLNGKIIRPAKVIISQ